MERYDDAEELSYRIMRFEPDQVESGYALQWIQEQLKEKSNGTDQTIPTDRSD
jgi:hypothetical protein